LKISWLNRNRKYLVFEGLGALPGVWAGLLCFVPILQRMLPSLKWVRCVH